MMDGYMSTTTANAHPTKTKTRVTITNTNNSNRTHEIISNEEQTVLTAHAVPGQTFPEDAPTRSRSRSRFWCVQAFCCQTKLNLSHTLREWRHSPCLMTPLTLLMALSISILSLLGLLFHFPELLLGLILSPMLRRGGLLVEFLYPWKFVGSAHIYLVQWSRRVPKSRKGSNVPSSPTSESHSRTVEQRYALIPNRVYVHCIPLLQDNIGYLIVYIPPAPTDSTPADTGKATLTGIIVDASDAHAITDFVEHVESSHYGGREIVIRKILSTHKHHDHTAGNYNLVKYYHPHLREVLGGAVERVPCMTTGMADGECVVWGDDCEGLEEFVEVEVLGVPSHTRGSVVYALRARGECGEGVPFLFTGDAMFSAGGGVPFEADFDHKGETLTMIRPSAGTKSTERCFAQILYRASKHNARNSNTHTNIHTLTTHTNNALVFPGHEYSAELLSRQLSNKSEAGKEWHKFPPSFFFETAAQNLISQHRRTLPRSGRLLTVPSPLQRELSINPHFRSLRRRGELFIQAVLVWYKQVSKEEFTARGNTKRRMFQSAGDHSPLSSEGDGSVIVVTDQSTASEQMQITYLPIQPKINNNTVAQSNTPSTINSWNMNPEHVQTDIFRTVYAADLDSIIHGLQSNTLSPNDAAELLSGLPKALESSTVTRKPIPGAWPGESSIRLGLLALAILGSPPTAMTLSDAKRMNLPPPQAYRKSSDEILISRTRLQTLLIQLGLIDVTSADSGAANTGATHRDTSWDVLHAIALLWKEAAVDDTEYNLPKTDSNTSNPTATTNTATTRKPNYSSVEYESKIVDMIEKGSSTSTNKSIPDEIELGWLKCVLYGPALPKAKRSKFCLPCFSPPPTQYEQLTLKRSNKRTTNTHSSKEPVTSTSSKQSKSPAITPRRSNGEILRHDVATCPMCKYAVGCPLLENERCRIVGNSNTPTPTSQSTRKSSYKISPKRTNGGSSAPNGTTARRVPSALVQHLQNTSFKAGSAAANAAAVAAGVRLEEGIEASFAESAVEMEVVDLASTRSIS